jgi:hypothetical protein
MRMVGLQFVLVLRRRFKMTMALLQLLATLILKRLLIALRAAVPSRSAAAVVILSGSMRRAPVFQKG